MDVMLPLLTPCFCFCEFSCPVFEAVPIATSNSYQLSIFLPNHFKSWVLSACLYLTTFLCLLLRIIQVFCMPPQATIYTYRALMLLEKVPSLAPLKMAICLNHQLVCHGCC
ncbi:hypothetical protein RDI58_025262 [Solanum bulbocastanum]|uniref:Uncharacterized protein n=1 Tax=Solanum bulbocastanum TaxID=147425 RepID=A0AAN8SZS3_SOLBU